MKKFLFTFLLPVFSLLSVSEIPVNNPIKNSATIESLQKSAKYTNISKYIGGARIWNTNPNILFIRSEWGQGYQAVLKKSDKNVLTKFGEIGSGSLNDYSKLECQSPLGIAVKCGDCKDSATLYSYGGQNCSSEETGFNFEQAFPFPKENFIDFLNTDKTRNLSYIFLDSIVNNTDFAFQIAVTDLPLVKGFKGIRAIVKDLPENFVGYDFTEHESSGDLMGLINQEEEEKIEEGEKVSPSIMSEIITRAQEGGGEEVDTGIGDSVVKLLGGIATGGANYSIYPKTRKTHMAQLDLAISNDEKTEKKYKTIILFPLEGYKKDDTCQPVILIGIDTTYLKIYVAAVVLKECDTSEKIKDRILTFMYEFPEQHLNLRRKDSARMKIVINPTKHVCSGEKMCYANVGKLELLKGLWWPDKKNKKGEPDDFKFDPTGEGENKILKVCLENKCEIEESESEKELETPSDLISTEENNFEETPETSEDLGYNQGEPDSTYSEGIEENLNSRDSTSDNKEPENYD